MIDKQAKIHSLGPRKMSSTGKNFYNSAGQNGFYQKPILPITTVPQPQIRYLLIQHPQFDALVKQLTALRAKYDELLIKFQQKSSQQTLRQNIQQVIQTTHDIQVKMSRIVQDANKMSSDSQDKQNNPAYKSKKISKQQHQRQCLQIIQTVNRATQKIEELQQKNIKLSKQIQTQRQWKSKLQNQNKRLRLMLQNMESQKEEEIQKYKNQIKLLTDKENLPSIQIKTNTQEKQVVPASITMSKKITNDHYLHESRYSQGVQEVSGFSRLTINGQASRISRVYE